MLQALTKNGDLLALARLSREHIQKVKKEPFYCPECKGQVIVRAGVKMIPHFAHQASTACTNGKGESDYHRQGKLLLYDWLLKQNLQTQIEKYFPEIKQRPDLFVQINTKKIVIEYQCARIDVDAIHRRNKGYHSLGITPIWILGANRFKRLGKQKIKIDLFTEQFLQHYSSDAPVFLLYFCPTTNTFSQVSDLYFITHQQAIAQFTFKKATLLTFTQLFQLPFLFEKQLLHAWLEEKRRFRIARKQYDGSEQRIRHWLYEKGLHVERLPALIHLPVPNQYIMKVTVWQWQCYFIIDYLDPLPIGTVFSIHSVYHFFRPFIQSHAIWQISIQHPGHAYIQLLTRLGILHAVDDAHFKKQRQIKFYGHIEEALKGDEVVIDQLINS
jgi:competence CoiA-like predicted nuclease